MALVLASGAALLGTAAANNAAEEGQATLAPPQELGAEASAADLMASVREARGQLCGVLEDLRMAVEDDQHLKGKKINERMTGITGLSMEEIDAKYNAACAEEAAEAGIVDLVNDHIIASWMLRAYGMAMEDHYEEKQEAREAKEAKEAREGNLRVATMPAGEGTGAAEAGGSEALQDYQEIHGAILATLQSKIETLEKEGTVEAARDVSTFLNEVLIPHEAAEEEAFGEIQAMVQDAQVQAALQEAMAGRDDLRQMVAQFDQALNAAEQGTADTGNLATMAREIHAAAEEHYAAEEDRVLQPMVQAGNDQAATTLVKQQVNRIGPWLQEQGWEPRSVSYGEAPAMQPGGMGEGTGGASPM